MLAKHVPTSDGPWLPRYTPQLDGLRALAVGLVVAYHVAGPSGGGRITGAFLGVDVFFVLSGFLITSLLLQEAVRTGGVQLLAFYRRRVWRLYPALLMTSVFVLLWFPLVPQPGGEATQRALSDNTEGVLYALGYLASWAFAFDWTDGIMGYTWSLSVEEHFYLVWPVVFLLVLRRRREHLLAWTVAIAACASAWPVVLRVVFHAGADRLYAAPDTRAGQMLVGCALAVLLARPGGLGRFSFLASTPVALSVLGLYAACVFAISRKGPVYLTGGQLAISLATCALLAHLTSRPSWLTRVFGSRPLVSVGQWSYGIYLFHKPLLYVPAAVMGLGVGSRVVGAALTLPLAALSFRYLESPLLRRFGRKPEAAAATPVQRGPQASARPRTSAR